jgi:xanthine dehydrogenase YagR molybdenum-binding subunit
MSDQTTTKDRVDGKDKVSGKAKYAADHRISNVAYGVFVGSTIAKGEMASLDVSQALASPGVLDVIYYKNCPALPGYQVSSTSSEPNREWPGHKVLYDNKVRYYGQPIALVVANTFEDALQAVRRVKATYKEEPFETDFHSARLRPELLKPMDTYLRGRAAAYAAAPVKVEAEYTIPIEVHSPMEMHATLAIWEGEDQLTVYDKSQGPSDTQNALASLFGISPEKVRVVVEYVGGAYGNALRSWANVPAACMAAKKLKRPVKVVLNRPQMFYMVGYRPQSWQRIGIGADLSGKLVGISHAAISNTSRYEEFTEGITNVSQFLYACPNVDTDYKLLPLDLSTPIWMRGPGEASGCFGLESALDELSYQLKMDPIDLRLANFTEINPQSQLPWSAIHLKECYAKGKELIGWQERKSAPRMNRQGDWWIGYGMAVGVFGAWKGEATVKATLYADGRLVLGTAVSDMGPGTATTQVIIAADALQMPSEKITFQLGDTRSLPPGIMQGGSGTTSTVGSAVFLACRQLKAQLCEWAKQFHPPFRSVPVTELNVRQEHVELKSNPAEKISIPVLLQRAGKQEFSLTVKSSGNDPDQFKYATNSFSAHFVKLGVHVQEGTVKIIQVVSTGDAGKIINEKAARSQMLGGVVGGIGMALKESLEIDHRTGKVTNASLNDYHVPLHTDVPKTEVWFVNQPDPYINEIGAKGLGEIALIGFAAAVTNAVYNAIGVRVRDLPVTPAKLGFTQ